MRTKRHWPRKQRTRTKNKNERRTRDKLRRFHARLESSLLPPPIDRRQRLFRYPRGVSRRVDAMQHFRAFRAHDVHVVAVLDVPGRAQHAQMQPRIVRIHHATKRVTRRRRSTHGRTNRERRRIIGRHIAEDRKWRENTKKNSYNNNTNLQKLLHNLFGKNVTEPNWFQTGSTAFCWVAQTTPPFASSWLDSSSSSSLSSSTMPLHSSSSSSRRRSFSRL